MAEEHRFEPPEGHRLCANHCGFFGSPATLGLCSKCYRDLRLKEQQTASAKLAVDKSLDGSGSSSTVSLFELRTESASDEAGGAPSASSSASEGSVAGLSRCSACRKRVGLMGFRCRCGATFCGAHRHAEVHGCTFDFKTVGRDEIARANPVVKAAKLSNCI